MVSIVRYLSIYFKVTDLQLFLTSFIKFGLAVKGTCKCNKLLWRVAERITKEQKLLRCTKKDQKLNTLIKFGCKFIIPFLTIFLVFDIF